MGEKKKDGDEAYGSKGFQSQRNIKDCYIKDRKRQQLCTEKQYESYKQFKININV